MVEFFFVDFKYYFVFLRLTMSKIYKSPGLLYNPENGKISETKCCVTNF